MTRRKQDPLRTLAEEERDVLVQIARAHSEPASHVARAKSLLAVADGKTYVTAAQAAVRVRLSHNWYLGLTRRVCQPLNLNMAGVRHPSTVLLNWNGFWPKRGAHRTGNKMERRLGR